MKKTMKKALLGILRSVVFLVLLYLIGAFVTWSFNPNSWDEKMRMLWGVLGFCAIVTSFLIVEDI